MTTPVISARTAGLSAAGGLMLVVAAHLIPTWWYEDIDIEFAPLHASWDPKLPASALLVIALGIILALALPKLATTLRWPVLLLTAFGTLWLWIIALAMTEGTEGLARTFERKQEYVFDAQRVTSISTMLHTFISRIPYSSPDNWHVHVAGHPPGALLYFVGIDRIGITDPFWIGVVCVTVASTAIVAVMVTLRTLGTESLARSAMPWIVLAPSAVWMGVNGDAVYTAVAAWGLALLAVAAKRVSTTAAFASGLLLGLCIYLSYGLVLLGIPAVAVLLIAKTWRPLPWVLGGAAIVAALFAIGGFSWWDAYPVLRRRYYDGIASDRPYWYWVWANLAAWTYTAGLAVWAALPVAWRNLRTNVIVQLAAASGFTILAATLSGMSKAETERIFLPFTIWIVALPALLPARWHRGLLLSQVALGLGAQLLLLTRW